MPPWRRPAESPVASVGGSPLQDVPTFGGQQLRSNCSISRTFPGNSPAEFDWPWWIDLTTKASNQIMEADPT